VLARALREIWQETVRRTDATLPDGRSSARSTIHSKPPKGKSRQVITPLGNTPDRLGVDQIWARLGVQKD